MRLLETLSSQEVKTSFIAIGLLALFAVAGSRLFSKLKLPNVIGEILGGLVLGPTVLGALLPRVYDSIFFGYPAQGKVLNIFYQLGLVLLMFTTGYDININIEKGNGKAVCGLLIGSSAVPFALGVAISKLFIDEYIGSTAQAPIFCLLFGLATSVTSIPVISKIFIDLNIIDTRFAGIMISSATIEDMIEWLILSVILGSTSGSNDVKSMIIVIAITLTAFVFSYLLMPKLLAACSNRLLGSEYLPMVFCVTYVAALTALGISIMYSALLAGLILRRTHKIEPAQIEKVKKLSLTFFIPIYFALVGLNVDLINNFNLFRFFLFFVIASALEVGGILLTLKIFKVCKQAMVNFAFSMSARGGPGIVLATVGYEYGIINLEFFTTLILTSVVSSLIAGTWLRMQTKNGKEVFTKIFAGD